MVILNKWNFGKSANRGCLLKFFFFDLKSGFNFQQFFWLEVYFDLSVEIIFLFNSFHPSLPLLATTSGQRHFEEPGNDSDDENAIDQEMKIQGDNSLRIWAAGEQEVTVEVG